MVHRLREEKHPSRINPVITGLEANDPAKRRRPDDRADRLRAQRQRKEPRCHTRRRTAARSARRMISVVRVSRRPRLKVGELGRDRLARDQRPVPFQPRHHIRFHPLEQLRRQLRTGLRGKPVHAKKVLHTHKQPEQRRPLRRIREAVQQRLGLSRQPRASPRLRQQRLDKRVLSVDAVANLLHVRNQIDLAASQRSPARKSSIRHQPFSSIANFALPIRNCSQSRGR